MKKKTVLVCSLVLIVVLGALIFVVQNKHGGAPAIPLVKVNDVLYVYDSAGYSVQELPETYSVIGEVLGEATDRTAAGQIQNGYAFGLKTGEKIYQSSVNPDEVFVYTTLFSGAGTYRYVRFTSSVGFASFAREEIRRIAAEARPDCAWNETTDICTSVALYDYDDVCNGYVFKLSTDGASTGYIQVNHINDELVVYCYSFHGIPAYEGLTIIGNSSFDPSEDRLYFFGNFAYCTKLPNGNFSPLDSVEEFTAQDIAAHYHNFLNQVKQREEECSAASATCQ